MRSVARLLRVVVALPLWAVDELRLWAAAIAGTRAGRRRRRRSEADTELLVPLSPHVGRAGARHASVDGHVRLRALQRRALTSFVVLLVAVVLGGLTGVLLMGARPVGPQVVPADRSTRQVPGPSPRISPSAPSGGVPGAEPTRRTTPRARPFAARAVEPDRDRAGGGLSSPLAADAGASPAASLDAATETSPAPSTRTTRRATAEPSPTGSSTPTDEPSPSPSDTPTLPGP